MKIPGIIILFCFLGLCLGQNLTEIVNSIENAFSTNCLIVSVEIDTFELRQGPNQFIHLSKNHLKSKSFEAIFGHVKSECTIILMKPELNPETNQFFHEVDKNVPKHVWVFFGQMSQSSEIATLRWPKIEVHGRAIKLYCPYDSKPKLLGGKMDCRKSHQGLELKVATLGFPPDIYFYANNTIKEGVEVSMIQTLGEYVGFRPVFKLGYLTFTNMTQDVIIGEADMGIKTILSHGLYQSLDYAGIHNALTFAYAVPAPKLANSFYQLIQPLEPRVWYCTIGASIVVSFLLYLITKMHQKCLFFSQAIDDNFWLDFALFPLGLILEPILNDVLWVKQVRRMLSAGIVLLALTIAGFFLTTIYKSILLAHLSAAQYEKPITTIKELFESNLPVFHFEDPTSYDTEYSANPLIRNIFRKALHEGWFFDYSSANGIFDQQIKLGLAGSLNVVEYYKYDLALSIKANKKVMYQPLKETIKVEQRGYVLAKNSPLSKQFGTVLDRMHAAGLDIKFWTSYSLSRADFAANAKRNPVALIVLSIKHFYSILMVLGFLFLLAIISFFLELKKVY